MKFRLIRGDCRVFIQQLHNDTIDAVVTDPPYELGFGGKKWDATGIAFDVDLWRDTMRAAKPGAHLVAFGGARTYHRMASAIEDAGWEILDSLLWLYGTGVPKSKRTALKPAYEPIVLARKRLAGTVDENLVLYGTGILNIDDCRIGDELRTLQATAGSKAGVFGGQRARAAKTVIGRWPANVLTDEAAAGVIDEQSWPAEASRLFYVAKASAVERGGGNCHPTVKPLLLMRYLVRLVAPAGGLVLDPFTGSGTTALATLQERRRFVGCEQQTDYVRIARGRVAAMAGWNRRRRTRGEERQDLARRDASSVKSKPISRG
jgi:DNA modification methylase